MKNSEYNLVGDIILVLLENNNDDKITKQIKKVTDVILKR